MSIKIPKTFKANSDFAFPILAAIICVAFFFESILPNYSFDGVIYIIFGIIFLFGAYVLLNLYLAKKSSQRLDEFDLFKEREKSRLARLFGAIVLVAACLFVLWSKKIFFVFFPEDFGSKQIVSQAIIYMVILNGLVDLVASFAIERKYLSGEDK